MIWAGGAEPALHFGHGGVGLARQHQLHQSEVELLADRHHAGLQAHQVFVTSAAWRAWRPETHLG